MKTPEIRRRNRHDVTDLFPSNQNLSDDSDSRRMQLRRDVRHLRRKDLIKSYSAEWNCFRAMKGRASSGVAVVDPRLGRFKDFLEVLGPCPRRGWTVDRVNPLDPEYAPGKVRWASKVTQANNRTNTIMLTSADGRVRPIAEWARITRQKQDTLRKRYERGWTDAEIITGKRSVRGCDEPPQQRRSIVRKWPSIVKSEDEWETAYTAWTRQSRHKRLTRDQFFIWIATNERRYRLARLERRFPDNIGDNVNPEYVPAPPLTDDPEYQWYARVSMAVDEVQAHTPIVACDGLSSLLRNETTVRRASGVHELLARMRRERSNQYDLPR
jgi:hypothetical protein